MKKLACLALALAAACGDDDPTPAKPDAAVSVDAPVDIDAPVDGPAPFVAPTPVKVNLSATGPDQLQSAVAAPGGGFYAAGFKADTVAGDRSVIVVKITAAGAVDTTWATNGVATTTMIFKGGSGEANIGVQMDGKIIVSATVANTIVAADRDIAVQRLNADGTLDATFGVAGTRVLDLNSGIDNGMGGLTGLDANRSLAIGPNNTIFVHGLQRGEGNNMMGNPRTDTDFATLKLTADGAVDTTWGGGDGKFLLDIQESNATARALRVLPDGSVLAGGYANSPGLGTVQPVLYKLTTAGALDANWATQGLFHETVLAVQTEIYQIAVHSGDITTAGYGRESGDQNDWVSMRFDVNTGARSTTFGGTTNGAPTFDVSGTMVGDNCRNAVALPDGKTALIGSTGPSNMPAQDAVFAIIDRDGELDTTYGTGITMYQLGNNGNDQFWGGAATDTHAIFVGYQGGGMTQTDTTNDDSYFVVLPIIR